MNFALSPEHQALRDRVRELVSAKIAPVAHIVDESTDVPWDMVRLLADEGLLALNVPKAYGGAYERVQALPICFVREELARGCAWAARIFGMQGLGSYSITLAGTEEQRARYLPDVSSGRKLAAFAVTEPEAGSDASALRTTAVLEGGEWVLNGQKWFISNAGVAGLYVVYAKTDPELRSKGVSAFIVPAETPGLEFRGLMEMMSPRPVGKLALVNCRVPQANMLGKRGGAFQIAMRNLDMYRPSVGASAVGVAQAALDMSLAYARSRKQFGKPIGEFQANQFKLADMETEIVAARLLVYYAAWAKDNFERSTSKEASMAKLYATETANRVLAHALQIHGAYGLLKSHHIERLFKEVRATTVYEGTSEIQRMVIGRALLAG
jgi:alkylation response protein AidB-like acyl-CoA dehydrogenase